jgi:hypothetical protein
VQDPVWKPAAAAATVANNGSTGTGGIFKGHAVPTSVAGQHGATLKLNGAVAVVTTAAAAANGATAAAAAAARRGGGAPAVTVVRGALQTSAAAVAAAGRLGSAVNGHHHNKNGRYVILVASLATAKRPIYAAKLQWGPSISS